MYFANNNLFCGDTINQTFLPESSITELSVNRYCGPIYKDSVKSACSLDSVLNSLYTVRTKICLS